jgi:beta-lactamase class A
MRRKGGIWLAALGLAAAGAMIVFADVQASTPPPANVPSPTATPSAAPTQPVQDTPAPPVPEPTPAPTPSPVVHPSFDPLAAALSGIATSSGANIGVVLVELGGGAPQAFSYNGSQQFEAASTYKLPLLMLLAQLIATGSVDQNGLVCYLEADWEDGWFQDYQDGACYTRNELANRIGQFSDNTAAHMLVRDVGGPDALNLFARGHGAVNSSFYVNNVTTAADLAALWAAEIRGEMGAAPAQAWLYPKLTRTRHEAGIPAGIPNAAVVHKTGQVDGVDHDAALVTGLKNGPFILVVMTDGIGGDAGFGIVAQIAASVAQYEGARPAA